jgi:hypothetical protein
MDRYFFHAWLVVLLVVRVQAETFGPTCAPPLPRPLYSQNPHQHHEKKSFSAPSSRQFSPSSSFYRNYIITMGFTDLVAETGLSGKPLRKKLALLELKDHD